MELRFGKSKIGCAPGLGSLFLLVLGAALIGASYLMLGPGSGVARDFVSTLRHRDEQGASALVDARLDARLRRALLEQHMDEPIASLAVGDGPHSWHVSFAQGQRCFRFTGQRDREIYVTVAEVDGEWKVTQVSFREGESAVCEEN